MVKTVNLCYASFITKKKKKSESHLLHDQIPLQGVVIWLLVTSVILPQGHEVVLQGHFSNLSDETESSEHRKQQGAHLVRFLGDSGWGRGRGLPLPSFLAPPPARVCAGGGRTQATVGPAPHTPEGHKQERGRGAQRIWLLSSSQTALNHLLF